MLGDFDQAVERLRNRVIDSRADGSLVRISTPIDEPDSEESARSRLRQFADALAPHLRQYWPQESGKVSS